MKANTTVTQAPPSPNCAVESTSDGGMKVHFRIDPQTADRIRKRAQTMDHATWLWENVLHRAVEGAVF